MKLFIYIILLLSQVNTFSLSSIFSEKIYCNKITNPSSRYSKISMDYSKFKNFDDIINILPEFHSTIIINNWIQYITPPPDEPEDVFEYDDTYNNTYKTNRIENVEKRMLKPNYLEKALYDFKVFIAINREEKNIIYFGWCPEPHLSNQKLAYLIAGKVYNNTIYIYRIAQNPYYDNILFVKSIDLVKRLEDLDFRNGEKFKFNYDNLHKYDNRYQKSWDFYKD